MTRGARKEGHSRRHRFTGRGSFAAALRSPRKLRSSEAVLHVTNGQPGHSRFGVALAKRTVSGAVDRNRLKRIAREAFRKHCVKFLGMDLVLVPRKAFTRESEAQWLAQLLELLERASGAG